MQQIILKAGLVILFIIILVSCKPARVAQQTPATSNHNEAFWTGLQALCGKAYKGTVINAPASDTVFKNKILIMHVRSCGQSVIRIPFMVGDDKSRTWVFSQLKNGIELKHDHRHKDGSEDSITMYGGITSNAGSATLQVFPADQHTVNILPAAASNVWWVELVPGQYFSYNLRRLTTDRIFTVRFDLTHPVDVPDAPWGWKE